MNYQKKLYVRTLFLGLLFSIALPVFASHDATNVSHEVAVGAQDGKASDVYDALSAHEEAVFAELLRDIADLFDRIDAMLDTIGQTYAHGAIGKKLKPEEKASVDALLFELRRAVSDLRARASVYTNRTQVIALAGLSAQLTDVLNTITDKGLLPLAQGKGLVQKKRSIQITGDNITTLKAADIEKLVKEVTQDLKKISQKSDELGLSKLNRNYRKARTVWNHYGIGTMVEYAAWYSVLFTWIIYMSDKSQIDNLPLPDGAKEKFKLFKDGASGKEITKEEGKKTDVQKKEIYFNKSSGELENSNDYVVVGKIDTSLIPKEGKDGKVVLKPKNSFEPKKEVRHIDDVVADYAALEFNQKKLNEALKVHADIVDADARQRAIDDSTAFFKEGLKREILSTAREITEESKNMYGLPPSSPLANFLYSISTFVSLKPSMIFEVPVSAYFAKGVYEDLQRLVAKAKKAKEVINDKLMGVVKQQSFNDTERYVGTDRFKDVVGRDDIKAELMKIIEYVCNPEKYDRTNITVEKGFLFVGPSQNGKSAMIRAFANELTDGMAKVGKGTKVRLLIIPVADIIKEGGLSKFVALAEHFGEPVVLAIDEFDMLCVQRDRDAKMLADVLTAMSSGLSASEKNMVIIIGLTNKPANIDFALRQHGRFGKIFWFDKPTYKDRLDFFAKECERRFMDPARFDFQKLAHETEGVSFGTLLSVTKRAFMLAKMAHVAVTQEHFEQAIDTEVKNIVFTGQELPLQKQEIIAVHQAGKALVSMLLDPSKKLCKVTTLPCTQELEEEHVNQAYNWDKTPVFKKKEQRVVRYGGIFSYALFDTLDMETEKDMRDQCKILLAGNMAQKVYGLKACAFDKDDKEAAYALARRVVFEGFDTLAGMPKKASEELLTQAYQLLKAYETEVANLLAQNKKALVALTEALKTRKELSRSEVEEIVANNK